MRIIWIVQEFPTSLADPSLAALTELAQRVAREHSLKIFVLQQPGPAESYRLGQAEVHSFGFRTGNKLSSLARFETLAKAIWEVSREPGEVVHAFRATGPTFVGLVANRLHKRPLIVSCLGEGSGFFPETSRRGTGNLHFYHNRVVTGAAAITVGSETQAGLLKARYPGLKPVVLPFGKEDTREQGDSETGQGVEYNPKTCAARTMRLYHEVFIKGLKKRN